MALQNRVDPWGQLIATPARGMWLGNRGWLHDASRRILRPWQVRRWIICQLEFRGRHREIMSPRRTWTELFFLDEATAFAAGHRPCGECRNADYRRFRDRWRAIHPGDLPGVDAMDRRLHDERTIGRQKRTARADIADLPDGAFVTEGGRAWLVREDALLAWSPSGYQERRVRPARGEVELLTPPTVVEIFRAGYRPHIHPSAER